MSIDWAALGEVFGVSLVVTVGIVGVFTLGIIGTARKAAPEGGEAAAPSGGARAGAMVCFAVCAAVVAYGIYLIVK
ncbi:hypothetical protein [Streptomyces boninensis]|uniref:hypothetical protein n=1 Tax=Streptomyces boninensis TaxID=2039455 RepID=UPI003B211E7B